LQKIQIQPSFKRNENPRRENSYTAYWMIDKNQLYLVKVTNRPSNDWSKLGVNDTLNLKKAFGHKYKNGKVSLRLKNNTIYLHKQFQLRQYWGWFPTYLEDYTLEFKKNSIFRV